MIKTINLCFYIVLRLYFYMYNKRAKTITNQNIFTQAQKTMVPTSFNRSGPCIFKRDYKRRLVIDLVVAKQKWRRHHFAHGHIVSPAVVGGILYFNIRRRRRFTINNTRRLQCNFGIRDPIV
jgi:hypothetical protein